MQQDESLSAIILNFVELAFFLKKEKSKRATMPNEALIYSLYEES